MFVRIGGCGESAMTYRHLHHHHHYHHHHHHHHRCCCCHHGHDYHHHHHDHNHLRRRRHASWGQVRHLPFPLEWDLCFQGGGAVGRGCPANGTYQNGAYWATPLHYLVQAVLNVGGEEALSGAVAVLNATMDYFRGRDSATWQGVNEAVNPDINYHGVDAYVASGTNVLKALALLDGTL
jgi:hypothetical protein